MSWLSEVAKRELRAKWLPKIFEMEDHLCECEWKVLGDGGSGCVFLNVTEHRVYKVFRRYRLHGLQECTIATFTQRVAPQCFAGFDLYWDGGVYFVGSAPHLQAVDLYSLIEVVDVPLLVHYMRQLVHCVELLHQHNVLHNDIKPENILVTPDNRVLLTDWGSATRGRTFKRETCGTRAYNHPSKWGSKTTDYYAVLVTTVIMLDKPYEVFTDMEDYEAALRECSAEAFGIMAFCMSKIALMRRYPNQEFNIKDGFLRVLAHHDDRLPATRPKHTARPARSPRSCSASADARRKGGADAGAAAASGAGHPAGLQRARPGQVLPCPAAPLARRHRSCP